MGIWIGKNEGAKFWMQVVTELKNRGVFPDDKSIQKIIFLALTNASKKWTMPIKDWSLALNQFAILILNSHLKIFQFDSIMS